MTYTEQLIIVQIDTNVFTTGRTRWYSQCKKINPLFQEPVSWNRMTVPKTPPEIEITVEDLGGATVTRCLFQTFHWCVQLRADKDRKSHWEHYENNNEMGWMCHLNNIRALVVNATVTLRVTLCVMLVEMVLSSSAAVGGDHDPSVTHPDMNVLTNTTPKNRLNFKNWEILLTWN